MFTYTTICSERRRWSGPQRGSHGQAFPRFPLTIFNCSGINDHQSLTRDHLAYRDLTSKRQQRANDIVIEKHALIVYREERRNSALSDALSQVPSFVVGKWAWRYITASTIRQGAKAGSTDPTVLKAKIAWTGPYKILAVGPCPSSDTPDGPPMGDKLLHIWISPQTCPAQMRTTVSPSSASSSAPTPTPAATCASVFRMGCRNTCSTI